MATSPSPPLAAHDLVRRLPPADEIRRRLDEIEAERRALMPLLRAARAAERAASRAKGVARA